jgi:hypothetical protein
MAVVALILDFRMKKAKALNKMSALKSSCLTPLPFSYESPRLEQPPPSFKPRVKQDDFKALKFYQKACGLNAGNGCSNLGFMYKEGKGVKQDECFEIILFNALAFFIHKSKKRATTARIQTTRLLVKLRMKKAKALNKMISRRSSFTKRRVV